MSALDQSLDQIVATRPKNHNRRGSKRSAKSEMLGTSGTTNAPGARARRGAGAAQPAVGSQGTASSNKIIVSNLPTDVNEAQIKELFGTTVGPLRRVDLTYDNQGRSKGVATVIFQRSEDGTKAYNAYNNRLIDGKRPMKIEIVVDLSRPATLAQRVAPAKDANAMEGVQSTNRGTGGRRGGGRGGRGGRRGGAARKPKTAEDLDQEMEDYSASTTNAGAAAPAAAT